MDSSKKYYELTIQAESSDTEIWLGTDDGHFVQKDCGEMRSSLLPGNYTVEFHLGGTTFPITLNRDQSLKESDIRSGPSCPRPAVVLIDRQEFLSGRR